MNPPHNRGPKASPMLPPNNIKEEAGASGYAIYCRNCNDHPLIGVGHACLYGSCRDSAKEGGSMATYKVGKENGMEKRAMNDHQSLLVH